MKDVAKVELHTDHALTPWLVRHCGWLICSYRVRSDASVFGAHAGRGGDSQRTVRLSLARAAAVGCYLRALLGGRAESFAAALYMQVVLVVVISITE